MTVCELKEILSTMPDDADVSILERLIASDDNFATDVTFKEYRDFRGHKKTKVVISDGC